MEITKTITEDNRRIFIIDVGDLSENEMAAGINRIKTEIELLQGNSDNDR